jgi:hypothetical protein
MSSMMPSAHLHAEVDAGRGYSSTAHAHSSNTHTLHSTRSMYAMPGSGSSLNGGSIHGGSSVTSGSGRGTWNNPAQYAPHGTAQNMPYDSGFPTQYPPHHSGGGHSSGSHRRPSHGDDWAAQQRHGGSGRAGSGASVASVGIASVNSASGRMSVNTSTTAGSRTQDDREYIPALLREQEAMFGVNMYDYLAPDDPEVVRLMAQFGFSKTDALIAVFQQFPPPVQPHGSRRDNRDYTQHRDMRGGHPGSRPAPAPAPVSSMPLPSTSSRNAPKVSLALHYLFRRIPALYAHRADRK